jgi:hypothetical protein
MLISNVPIMKTRLYGQGDVVLSRKGALIDVRILDIYRVSQKKHETPLK